jgi:hypothetical protein
VFEKRTKPEEKESNTRTNGKPTQTKGTLFKSHTSQTSSYIIILTHTFLLNLFKKQHTHTKLLAHNLDCTYHTKHGQHGKISNQKERKSDGRIRRPHTHLPHKKTGKRDQKNLSPWPWYNIIQFIKYITKGPKEPYHKMVVAKRKTKNIQLVSSLSYSYGITVNHKIINSCQNLF